MGVVREAWREAGERTHGLHRRLAPWSVGLAALLAAAAVLGLNPLGFTRPWLSWIALVVVVLCGLVAPIALARRPGRPGVPATLGVAAAVAGRSLLLAAHALPLLLVAGFPDPGLLSLLGVAGVTALAALSTAVFAVAWRSVLRRGRVATAAAVLTVGALWLTPLVPDPYTAGAGFWSVSPESRLEVRTGTPPPPTTLSCLGAGLRPPGSRFDAAEWVASASPLQLLGQAVPARPSGRVPANPAQPQPADWYYGFLDGRRTVADGAIVELDTSPGLNSFRAATLDDPACARYIPVWPRGILVLLVLLAGTLVVVSASRALAVRRDRAG